MGGLPRDAAVSLRARRVRVRDRARQEGLGQDRHSGRNGWGVGYPVMLRSAFALGGFGSGIARDRKDLVKIATQVGGGWWGVGRSPCDAAVSLRARRVRVGDSAGQEGLGQDRHSGRNGGVGDEGVVGRLPRDAAVSLRARRVRVGDSAGQEGLGQDRHSGRWGVVGGWSVTP